MNIKTKEDFSTFVQAVEARPGYRKPAAFGIGFAHVSSSDNILDAWFPVPNYKTSYGTAAVLAHHFHHLSGSKTYVIDLSSQCMDILTEYFGPFKDEPGHANVEVIKSLASVIDRGVMVVTFIEDLDEAPKNVADAYLRLHLLSHRMVLPNTINTDVFGILPNNVWTNEGPVAPEDLMGRKLAALKRGAILHVNAVDKIPRMVDYFVPTGVRIADASRVRLGAHLAEKTTVMHEGFVNFNAGTLGEAMIEGRISQGVIVGDKSDLGGGCSTMGTLSGGGKEKIAIGPGCLIGANGGTGISLGKLCVIEAGLYITAGMKLSYNEEIMKASELSGRDGLTFRRDSLTGEVEALDKPNNVALNEVLHNND